MCYYVTDFLKQLKKLINFKYTIDFLQSTNMFQILNVSSKTKILVFYLTN